MHMMDFNAKSSTEEMNRDRQNHLHMEWASLRSFFDICFSYGRWQLDLNIEGLDLTCNICTLFISFSRYSTLYKQQPKNWHIASVQKTETGWDPTQNKPSASRFATSERKIKDLTSYKKWSVYQRSQLNIRKGIKGSETSVKKLANWNKYQDQNV